MPLQQVCRIAMYSLLDRYIHARNDTRRHGYLLRKTLGQNIKARREELGLSKVDLCIAADIQRPILDRIEQGLGNIRLDTLQSLADVLKTTPSNLIKDPNEQ